MRQLANEGDPSIQKELRHWERREAQVLDSIASEEEVLQDMHDDYEREAILEEIDLAQW